MQFCIYTRLKFCLYFRSVVIPVVISATLMVLSALSGYLSIVQLYLNRFNFYHQEGDEAPSSQINLKSATISFDGTIPLNTEVFEDVTSLTLGVGAASSAACCLLVGRVGGKRLMLLSTSLMAASMFFLTLLSHFSEGTLIGVIL